jgi:hypothetical protein
MTHVSLLCTNECWTKECQVSRDWSCVSGPCYALRSVEWQQFYACDENLAKENKTMM